MKTHKKFIAGCSPLTGKIYAGIVKNSMWIERYDITETAVDAVAQHLLHCEQDVKFEMDGKTYVILVREVDKDGDLIIG